MSDAPDPLAGYRHRLESRPESIDETLSVTGVRETSEALAAHIGQLGVDGLLERRDAARRFVADDGITYGARGADGDEPTEPRDWALDPLPLVISGREWAGLDLGLRQRAVLLDAVLADLTGEQLLVRDGVLPGAAIYGHSGWLPQAEGITLPGPRQLVLPATDLARDADGAWRVFSDRAQAPSGAGYAMANRRIIARVMPALHRSADLSRLRGFFDGVQRALQVAAPPSDDAPRAVILTPGALSETAFDQAFQSTLLGLPLVESEDLTSRDGRIWMRTTSGLTPVDVIVRRVDADWCDQLELRSESRLGLPGMVEAARLGHVSLVNPLSAGVLENPALIPYLPRLCRHVLGEDLRLSSPRTWWAGETSHRSHIVENLAGLVIKPIDRGPDLTSPHSVFGWELSAAERDELALRIQAQPWRWTAQDPLAMSTAPVVTDEGLDPRDVVLRTFAVADDEDYLVMPGGLGRVSVGQGSAAVSHLAGSPSKDVWVLAGDVAPAVERDDDGGITLLPAAGRTQPATWSAPAPRVASDLYWMGRYAERAESAARLLRVADNLVDDHAGRPGTTGHTAMLAVLGAVSEVTAVRPGFTGDDAAARLADPLTHLRELTLDPHLTGSVAYSAHRAVVAAQAVREQLSVDTWLVMSRLERTLRHARDEDDLQELLMETLEGLLALAGIGVESLVRDPAWAFIDAGKRIERAQQTIRLLTHTLAVERTPLVEGATTEAALLAAESAITFRRRLAAGLGPHSPIQAAVDLLVKDASNPRSIAFQLRELSDDLALIGDESAADLAGQLVDGVRAFDLDHLVGAGGPDERAGLRGALTELGEDLSTVHQAISRHSFVRKGTQRTVRWGSWSDGADSW